MKLISIAVFAALMIAGCKQPQPMLDTNNVGKLEIIYPNGGTVVTDAAIIQELADAMLKAKPDNGVYDTAMSILITGYRGENIAWRIRAGSPFVNVNGQQYRCPAFHAVLGKVITKQKTDTQPKPDGEGLKPAP